MKALSVVSASRTVQRPADSIERQSNPRAFRVSTIAERCSGHATMRTAPPAPDETNSSTSEQRSSRRSKKFTAWKGPCDERTDAILGSLRRAPRPPGSRTSHGGFDCTPPRAGARRRFGPAPDTQSGTLLGSLALRLALGVEQPLDAALQDQLAHRHLLVEEGARALVDLDVGNQPFAD